MSITLDGRVEQGAFSLSVNLSIPTGQTVAVLGPNGAGKSTLLRVLAGLQPLSDGRLEMDGSTVDDSSTFTPAQNRSCGVVFQDYALFPHLTVLQNAAFGLRARGTRRQAAEKQAHAMLARLNVDDLAGRRPTEISGGQAQRVALARALAPSPAVLLLDEPTSALDVDARDAVRAELDGVLADFPGCSVLVTHDPLDAMVLADRVVVLEAGRIVQDGAPAELAEHPATDYVAALMGVTLLRGTADSGVLRIDGGGELRIADMQARGRVLCVVRPESVTVHRHRPEGSARNTWIGTVASLQPSADRVRVIVDGTPRIAAAVTHAALADLGLAKGTPVWVSLKALDLAVYPNPGH